MRLTLICPSFLKGALGVTVNIRLSKTIKLLFVFLYASITSIVVADNHPSKIVDQACIQGSLTHIQNHYLDNNYLIMARGQTMHQQQRMLFLVSYPVEYFSMVSLNSLGNSHYEACVLSTAREVDYRDNHAPVRELFARTERAHQIFNDEIPTTQCESDHMLCSFWPSQIDPSSSIILSAYHVANAASNVSYDETVKLKIGRHVIAPSRGRLMQLARTKYSLRINNQLDESTSDIETGKQIYRQIHQKFDHKLALIIFSHDHAYDWKVEKIDRDTGHISILNHGKLLEMYPLSTNTYTTFRSD